MIKHTKESIKQKLENDGRTIIMVGDYLGTKISTDFECLVCGYVWPITYSSIQQNSGCPQCYGNVKTTNEDIDKIIKEENRPIERLENIVNTVTKMKWRCLVDGCNHIWGTSWSNIKKGTGCAECYKRKTNITNEGIDKTLNDENRPITRLEDFIDSYTKINWLCLVEGCVHIWPARWDSIQRGGGCPVCKNKNEKRILEHLREIYGKKNVKHHHSIYDNDRRYEIDYLVNGIFIEYHGRQHYGPVCFGGISIAKAKAGFIKQVKRDYEVREYCKVHNIRLIEIPWWFSHEEQYKLILGLI